MQLMDSQTRIVTGAGRRLTFFNDVEMVVERSDLVDLGLRQPHLLGQRAQMARLQAAELVLNQVQVLDQEIAAPLSVAEQRTNLGERRVIDDAAFRPTLAARARSFRSHWMSLSPLEWPGWLEQRGISKAIHYLSRFDARDALLELDHAVGIH